MHQGDQVVFCFCNALVESLTKSRKVRTLSVVDNDQLIKRVVYAGRRQKIVFKVRAKTNTHKADGTTRQVGIDLEDRESSLRHAPFSFVTGSEDDRTSIL